MAHLVVLGVDNHDDAERLFDLAGDLAGDLAKQELLQLGTPPTPTVTTAARSASTRR